MTRSPDRRGGLRMLPALIALLLAAGWGVAAYLLLRTQVPADLALPSLDEAEFFTARQLEEAERYDRFSRINWILSTVALLVSLAAYARWGHHFTRESAAGRIGTGMLLAMLGFAIVWLVQVPFGIAQLWWDRRNDVAELTYAEWLLNNWLTLGTEFLFVSFAILIVMGIAGWLGGRWWILGAPVFVGLALLFAFSFPYLLPGVGEFEDRQLAGEARTLATELGVEDIPIRVQEVDEFTDSANAFAGGLGPSRRVVLWNTLLDGRFSDGEIRVVLTHEFAHHSENHIWKGLAWYALLALPGAYLIARLTRRRGGMAEARAVPVALLIFVTLNVLALPIDNMISRRYEAEADWVALQTTREPDAARQLFRSFADTALQDPTPPGWAFVWLDSHPTLLQRTAMAEAWEARQAP
ncbi:MAG: M48 family metalloprotease [Gaiellaceae bacterium]